MRIGCGEAMRQTGEAGLKRLPPRFKRLLTAFPVFAGAFLAYCVFTASFGGNSAGMGAGCASAMTKSREAIRRAAGRGDSPLTAARGDGLRRSGAGMGSGPVGKLWREG